MNIKNFTRNLESIQNSLLASGFMSETRRSSFSDDKLAMLLTEIAKMAIQTALSLEELEQKERSLALSEEKTRQEVELMLLNARFQNRIQLIEALKGLIQAHAMAKASGDNANINKANAYNAFLNIIGNAENTSTVGYHAGNVINTINAIDSKGIDHYDALMESIKKDAEQLLAYEAKEVMLYTPKMEVEVGETIKLMGINIYAEVGMFYVNYEKICSGNTAFFTPDRIGEHLVEYKVYKDREKCLSDTIVLKAIKTEFGKEQEKGPSFNYGAILEEFQDDGT